eukprot:461382_1
MNFPLVISFILTVIICAAIVITTSIRKRQLRDMFGSNDNFMQLLGQSYLSAEYSFFRRLSSSAYRRRGETEQAIRIHLQSLKRRMSVAHLFNGDVDNILQQDPVVVDSDSDESDRSVDNPPQVMSDTDAGIKGIQLRSESL